MVGESPKLYKHVLAIAEEVKNVLVVKLLNPDLIVISREFVIVRNCFIDAIKMGIFKTALYKKYKCFLLLTDCGID